MRAKRVDTNHRLIVETLRTIGCSVFDASGIGKGFPDLVIGIRGKTILVEVKASAKAKFTDAQLDFMERWNGSPVWRVESVDDAVDLVNKMV